jgi:UDP:flavonoid glycosyltransferase YjiC (YdhE family)
MRVAIQTLGTRGDVQPYLALALGLIARGHEAQLAAPEQFSDMAGAYGVPFAPLPGALLGLIDSPEGKAAIAGGRGFSAGFRLLKQVRPLMRRLLDREWAVACAFAPDLILHHPKSLASLHMAEKLGVPAMLASPLPGFTPTAAFPTPLLPFGSLGPLNRASHMLAIHGGAMLFRGAIQAWRRDALGLPSRAASRAHAAGTLYAYSPSLIPVPPDWGDDVLVSGHWFLDSGDWLPPPALARFLACGDAPIYVGFGSMPGLDPDRLSRMVSEALAKVGRRGILATGGGALAAGDAPPHVHIIDHAPHDRLFAHVTATSHHGGAGTTAASLRAGLPTIICPFFGDQPFWARRIVALQVGPPTLDRRRLSVETLAAAFAATAEYGMRRRAAALGEAIRNDNGVSDAVDFIETRADAWRARQN